MAMEVGHGDDGIIMVRRNKVKKKKRGEEGGWPNLSKMLQKLIFLRSMCKSHEFFYQNINGKS